MIELDCAVQTYAWGKRGLDSPVAQFKQSQDKNFKIDDNKTYAELWMGTHSNGPSMIMNRKDQKLSEFMGTELPFLFKILSVNQALSIQAHPNKELAAVLHAKDPKNYADSNHKPEMLIALTKFQALCGFRPFKEIKEHFKNIPELVKLCDQSNVKEFCGDEHVTLRKCFSSMMRRDEAFIRQVFEDFLRNCETYSISSKLKELFIRLHATYPFDIGCFSIFLLNYIELEPNEAIYLAASVPHAYLYGDGVECMACSDNVVRAGLTPKFKDVQTLVDMLDYRMYDIHESLVRPQKQGECIFEYKPAVDEFSVQRIEMSNNIQSIDVPALNKYSILIIIDANNAFASRNDEFVELKKGLVFFIEKNIQINIRKRSGENEENSFLLAYRAYVNIDEDDVK